MRLLVVRWRSYVARENLAEGSHGGGFGQGGGTSWWKAYHMNNNIIDHRSGEGLFRDGELRNKGVQI